MEPFDFWEMETQFWKAGKDFYRAHLAQQALMVFPQPIGVLDRTAILASISGPRWTSVEFSRQHSIRPEPHVAILTYVAEARGAAATGYRTFAVSVYVLSDAWKLAFHQQTPIGPDQATVG
jgi:hypothetical protein